MKLLAVVAVLAGCIDPVDERWQLDHDHVAAVRATPPGIMPGEHATLDALVAHAGAPATIETAATSVEAPSAPPALQAMVAFDGTAWVVTAPDAATLAGSRPAMGVDPGAPVPLELVLAFPHAGGSLVVTKTVWLGSHADNPAVPAITVGELPAGDTLEVPIATDVYVSAAVSNARVNWLTSCGTLFQDDEPRAFVHVDQATEGELAVVVRDPAGGVAWHVWPMIAR